MSLRDYLFGPELMSKAEVMQLIEAKERHHVRRFENQVQILKAKISEMEGIRHRVNQLEAMLPKRDEKGHFVKRENLQPLTPFKRIDSGDRKVDWKDVCEELGMNND